MKLVSEMRNSLTANALELNRTEELVEDQVETVPAEVLETAAPEPELKPELEVEPEAEPAPAQLAAAKMPEVEVKRWHGTADSRVFGWQRMPIREALRLQEDTFRCPECLGRVRLRAASPEKGLAERGEHYSKNPGCSLGEAYDGQKKPHIKPIN